MAVSTEKQKEKVDSWKDNLFLEKYLKKKKKYNSLKMPAPPPPPPSLPEAPSCDNTNYNDTDNLPPWAKITLTSAEAEIEKLIARNELKDAEVTYFCQVEPIIQDGPQ